jgi:hypothetical protein
MRQLTTTAMRARLDRLADLAEGLGREVAHWKDQDRPLAYPERRVYLAALQDAIKGFEDARATLAAALARIERGR